MRNLFTTTILTLVFISISSAQDKGDIEFGVNIGYNGSRAQVSRSYFDLDSGQGLNVGVSADYYFSNRWSIKGKIIYDQKGWDNDFSYGIVPAYPNNPRVDINLNYITIPVMANWHFGNTRNWYLNFGPYAGFLLSANETHGKGDIKEFFNTNDFGLAVGIGVKIPVSDKLKVNLEYEGQGGLTEVFKQNEAYRGTNLRYSLNVGLNFLLK